MDEDQNPCFWDLAADAEGQLEEEMDIVPSSIIVDDYDDHLAVSAWQDDEDEEDRIMALENNKENCFHTRGDGFHQDLDQSAHSNHLQPCHEDVHVHAQDSAALVSPISLCRDVTEDQEDEDELLATEAFIRADVVSSSSSSANFEHPVKQPLSSSSENTRSSNIHHDGADESEEPIAIQYRRLMKRLALSMERTDETRSFFKRRKLHVGGSFLFSGPDSHDLEESRKTLFRILIRESSSSAEGGSSSSSSSDESKEEEDKSFSFLPCAPEL